MWNVRRADEGQTEFVGPGWRLLLVLPLQREGLCIERGIASRPVDRAVGLSRIEAAKVAAATAAAKTATCATESSSESAAAKASAPAKAAKQAATLETCLPPGQTALLANRLHRITKPIHVHARQRTHLAGLAGNRYRIAAEVGIAGC